MSENVTEQAARIAAMRARRAQSRFPTFDNYSYEDIDTLLAEITRLTAERDAAQQLAWINEQEKIRVEMARDEVIAERDAARADNAVLIAAYQRINDDYLAVASRAPQSVYDELGWTIADTSRQVLDHLDVLDANHPGAAFLAVVEAAKAWLLAFDRGDASGYSEGLDRLANAVRVYEQGSRL